MVADIISKFHFIVHIDLYFQQSAQLCHLAKAKSTFNNCKYILCIRIWNSPRTSNDWSEIKMRHNTQLHSV